MRASSSLLPIPNDATARRDVRRVPFVELYNGRLQGVVSSGSDISRVYVSFFESGTLDYYCSTNNNRPCGGLRGTPCKHLQHLVNEAAVQFGVMHVATFLRLPAEAVQLETASDLAAQIGGRLAGNVRKEATGEVFSRFLSYLRYLELAHSLQPVPEMAWFV